MVSDEMYFYKVGVNLAIPFIGQKSLQKFFNTRTYRHHLLGLHSN